MVLDIICLVTLFVWAVFGYRKGFIKQIFALAGVLGIMFFSVPLAEIVETIIEKDLGLFITGRFLKGALLAACAALIYIISYAIGRFMHDTLVKGIDFAETTNHVLGTTLGLIESTLALYFILCLTSMVQEKVEDYAPAVYKVVNESTAFHIADDNNLVENSEFFTKLRRPEDLKKNKTKTPEITPENAPDAATPPESQQADDKKVN